MKKLLIATAVSAAFAAPGIAFAQAKPPAVPTLDKVLEASGISVSGYMDVAYTYANKNIEAGIGTPPVAPRVFDNQNNSFGLHQFGLTVAKQPKEGFGGLVNLTVGKDAQVIHSFPEAGGSSMFDVTQAFMQYATGSLTVIAGKYATMHGTEVIASTGNTNFSRSILFGAVPFTHTGLRATWALSDTVSLMAGVNNGWDQLTDQNKGKTVELGATLNPIKPLAITVSGMSGKEPTGTTAVPNDGTRTSLNVVASYTIIDPLTVGLEYLSVSQDNVGGLGTKQKYDGEALYVTYMVTPKLRGVLRVESFDDKDGFHFATAGTKYKEGTVTVSYLANDSFEARVEVRRDQATNAVFTDSTGATSKTLMTGALQGLYKF
jgi:predicted porin